MTNLTRQKAEHLKELTGNSLSSLIDYLINKEYSYSEKYKQEELKEAKNVIDNVNDLNFAKKKGVSVETIKQWKQQFEILKGEE